jgi:hypothetical protein
MNFLFRKGGLVVRVYADNCGKYADLLDRLPENMEKELAKAPVCKRLVNPDDCNPKCIMGYDFSVKKKRHQKCRYQCFRFEVTPESVPVLQELIDSERRERNS